MFDRAAIEALATAPPRPHGNCYWLLPARLLAGEHPARHLERLETAGVTHFVDLTEAQAYRPQRALHLWHPITDFGVPSAAGLQATLQAMDDALASGGLVYLHCRAGIGRTGTLAACWLVQQGYAAEDALALVQQRFALTDKAQGWLRPQSPETEAQRHCVREFAATLGR